MSLRAYLELSRISNLPTCWSNVLVGAALAAGRGEVSWRGVLLPGAAVSCLYVGGMALNDAVDAPRDAAERPGRPIPSGRVSRAAATVFALGALAAGVGLAAAAGAGCAIVAVSLALCIVAYDLLHHRLAASVPLMGLCRGLVYLLAAAASGGPSNWQTAWWMAGALAAYVTLVTVIARREAGGPAGVRRWLSLALPPVAVAPVLVGAPAEWGWAIAAALLLVAWLARSAVMVLRDPPRTQAAVMGWLSGICLLDAFYLALLQHPGAAAAAAACFALTATGHRAVSGT